MKIVDDRTAKIRIWAKEGRVHPIPPFPGYPNFRSRRFSSYKEFNDWKREQILQFARTGGVKWTK